MKLIVGLGNPGRKYEDTRHNLGFMVVDELLRKLTPMEKTAWQEVKKLRAQTYKHKGKFILAKPQTMMNNSGIAVKSLITNYSITQLLDLWIIHDDLDLPLGKIKIVQGRGAAGHKGVESVIKEIGTNEFVRFRLGIGRPRLRQGSGGQVDHKLSEQEAESFVLSPFAQNEKSKTKRLIKKAIQSIEVALKEGIEVAMNRTN